MKKKGKIVSDMKYAIYVRKSSEGSEKQVQSIENQLDILKEKAKKENLEVVDIYIDEKTATKPRIRQDYQRMLNDIYAGKIDAILCWSPDRLARNPIDGGEIQYLLSQGILKIINAYDRKFLPEDNSLILNFEMGMSTEYSITLSKNVKRGHAHKIKKGLYPNQAPIGYLNDYSKAKGEKSVIPDPERFELVKKCWEMALKGESVPQIYEKAKKLGLTSPASRKKAEKNISLQGFYTIFRNPFYYGVFRWSKKLNKGRHIAMITPQEFDKVQRLIANRNRPKKAKHDYAYRGLVICGECGATITIAPKNKIRVDGSINARDYYRCTRRKANVECHQKSIRAEELEKQIVEKINAITIPPEFNLWAQQWLEKVNEEEFQELERIKQKIVKRIDSIDKQLKNLVHMRIQESIDDEIFKGEKFALDSEKSVLNRELNQYSISHSERIDKTIEIFDFCRDARDLYNLGTIEDKDLVLRTLGSHLSLRDKKLDIVLKPQFELISKANNEGLTLNPRFPTLPTRIEKGFDVETCELIKNGGGAEVLPPGSNSYQK